MNLLKTPKHSVDFLMLTFLFYITLPILEWLSLKSDLANGILSPNADSIGLDLIEFIFTLIIFAPIVSGFVIWIVWSYPVQVSLFSYNEKRPFLSFIWTLILGFLSCDSLAYGIIKTAEGNFAETIKSIIICYFCLLFRAAIIFRKGERRWAF